MTKGIKLPSMLRNNSKILEQELMSCIHIDHDFFICRTGFIISNPPSVYKFKSSFFNLSSHYISNCFILFMPPFLEKVNFSLRKFSQLIGFKGLYYSSNNTFCPLVIVFLRSACPSNIIMRMSYNMKI